MTKKIIFNTLGVLAVILAIVGIFLPLLPTTPFLLLASACFARGSERMQRWLYSNKLFGSYLANIRAGLGVPLRTKIVAITVLWLSLGFSAWHIPLLWVQCLLLIPGVSVTVYLIRMQTLPPKNPV